MKKLTLSVLVASAFSISAFAGSDVDKISSTFASLDNDSDGYISQEEADDDDIWEHFAKIDGGVDGVKDKMISREEFTLYMDKYSGEVATSTDVARSAVEAKVKDLDPIEHNFEELDQDGSGYISLQEAESHTVEKHFGYMDSNKDKKISMDEFGEYTARIKTEGMVKVVSSN